MPTVDINAASTRLSQLVDQAAAGEEIIIAKSGEPVARLVAVRPESALERRLGLLAGRGSIRDDFDAPLPDALIDSFEGRV